MNQYFVTGSSRGIGKAFSEYVLANDDAKVVGYARGEGFELKGYEHVQVDLANEQEVDNLQFPDAKGADRLVLMNNAASLGKVAYCGGLDTQTIGKTLSLNLHAPIALCDKFMRKYADHPAEKIILNISSGAGKYPVDGWSLYCSSKAGLDRFSEVLQLEYNRRFRDSRLRVFSVAPGVVDTEMQREIRGSEQPEFSRVAEFQRMKDEGMLDAPAGVAARLFSLIQNSEDFEEVVIRL